MPQVLEETVVVECMNDHRKLIVPADAIRDGAPDKRIYGTNVGQAFVSRYGGIFCNESCRDDFCED